MIGCYSSYLKNSMVFFFDSVCLINELLNMVLGVVLEFIFIDSSALTGSVMIVALGVEFTDSRVLRGVVSMVLQMLLGVLI